MNKIHRIRIIIIAIVWTMLGALLTFYDYWLMKSHLSEGLEASYTFVDAFVFNLATGFSGGVMGGLALTAINHKLRDRPYYYRLLLIVLAFVVIFSVITIFVALIPTIINFSNPWDNPEAKAFYLAQILTTLHLKNIIFWGAVVSITHLAIQVSDKFGPGNLWKMVTGKYHLPVFENRIFMFLDLKSSTAIAEKLGDDKYHQFLKDVFADITNPIIKNKAEIYQYVGDEVVVSWELKKMENKVNCLKCFFDIQAELEGKRTKYADKYDVFPIFKAGAHSGEVVAGEIGIIKSDITFSGDVLNTTARIQGQCNALNAALLISKELLEFINPKTDHWLVKSKGHISLRGKQKDLELVSIDEIN